MYLWAFNYIGTFFVIVLFLLFGVLCGYTAKEDDNSFWLGFVIGIFGNLFGFLVLLYVGKTFEKRTFEPNFNNHTNKRVSTIETLAELNDNDKLSDEEFKRLKNKIIPDNG